MGVTRTVEELARMLGVRRRRRILGLPVGPQRTDWERVARLGAATLGTTAVARAARRALSRVTRGDDVVPEPDGHDGPRPDDDRGSGRDADGPPDREDAPDPGTADADQAGGQPEADAPEPAEEGPDETGEDPESDAAELTEAERAVVRSLRRLQERTGQRLADVRSLERPGDGDAPGFVVEVELAEEPGGDRTGYRVVAGTDGSLQSYEKVSSPADGS